MSAKALRVIEIVSLQDNLLLPWLDLYETSFPASERILVSDYVRLLKEKACGGAGKHHLLAALHEPDDLAGMAHYTDEGNLAALWYLAVRQDYRSRGLGAILYEEILRRVSSHQCQALLFEVEIPELVNHAGGRELAERRIRFYQRLGARRLSGIEYWQDLGWHQRPIQMHLMLHPIQPTNPQDAFSMAKCLFGSNLTQTGELVLE